MYELKFTDRHSTCVRRTSWKFEARFDKRFKNIKINSDKSNYAKHSLESHRSNCRIEKSMEIFEIMSQSRPLNAYKIYQQIWKKKK